VSGWVSCLNLIYAIALLRKRLIILQRRLNYTLKVCSLIINPFRKRI